MGSNMDKIYIVMNYVEHDLKSLMETMKQPFLPGTARVPVRTAHPRAAQATGSVLGGGGTLACDPDPGTPGACSRAPRP